MAPCLFEIGQSVFYTPDQIHPNALRSGAYVIRAILTDGTNGHRYRIRSDVETFDRVAHEHELRLTTA
jgi:uncharacterized protein with von Willebrand factor type A (vWA) domain